MICVNAKASAEVHWNEVCVYLELIFIVESEIAVANGQHKSQFSKKEFSKI